MIDEKTGEFVQRPMNELFAALAKAQGKFEPVAMKGKVDFYSKKMGSQVKYDYVTFADIFKMAHKILSDNELCVIQRTERGELLTWLCHSSGQYIESITKLPGSNDIKTLGAQMSLLKRYQYLAICGIVATDDDDESGIDSEVKSTPKPEKKEQPTNHINDIFSEVQERTKDYYKNKPHLSNALKKMGLTGWPSASDEDGINAAIMAGIKWVNQKLDEEADDAEY